MSDVPYGWPSSAPPIETLRACIRYFDANTTTFGSTVELLLEQHREVTEGGHGSLVPARPPKAAGVTGARRHLVSAANPQTLQQQWAGEGELSAALKKERANSEKMKWSIETLEDEIQSLKITQKRRDDSLKKAELQVSKVEVQLAEVRSQLVMSISQNQRFIQQAASERANVSKLRSEISMVQTNNQQRFVDKTTEMKEQLVSSVEKLKDMEHNQRATEAELVAVKIEMKNLEHRFTNVAEEYDSAIGTINDRDEELATLSEALSQEQAHSRSVLHQLTDLKVKYGEVSFRDTLLAKNSDWGVCARLLQSPPRKVHLDLRLLQDATARRLRKGKKQRAPPMDELSSLGVCFDGSDAHYLLGSGRPPNYIPVRLAQRVVLDCLVWWDSDEQNSTSPRCTFPEVLVLLTSLGPTEIGSSQPQKRRAVVDLVERSSLLVGHVARHLLDIAQDMKPAIPDVGETTYRCLDALPTLVVDGSLLRDPSIKESMSSRVTKFKPPVVRGSVLITAMATASGALEMPTTASEPMLYHADLLRTAEEAGKVSSPLNMWSKSLSPAKGSALRAGLYNTLQVVGSNESLVGDALAGLSWFVALEQLIPGCAGRSLLKILDTLCAIFSAQDAASSGGSRRNMLPVSVAHDITEIVCNRVGYCYRSSCERWVRFNSMDKSRRAKPTSSSASSATLFPTGCASGGGEADHAFSIVDDYRFYFPTSFLDWKPLASDDISLAKLAMSVEFNTPFIPYAELFRPRRDADGNCLRPFVNTMLWFNVHRCSEFYRHVYDSLGSLLQGASRDRPYCKVLSPDADLFPTEADTQAATVSIVMVVNTLRDIVTKYSFSSRNDSETGCKAQFPAAASDQPPFSNFRASQLFDVAGVVIATRLITYFLSVQSADISTTVAPRGVDEAVDVVGRMRFSWSTLVRFIGTTNILGEVSRNCVEKCIQSLGVHDTPETAISQFELSLMSMFDDNGGDKPTGGSTLGIQPLIDPRSFVAVEEDTSLRDTPQQQVDVLGVSCTPLSLVEGMGM